MSGESGRMKEDIFACCKACRMVTGSIVRKLGLILGEDRAQNEQVFYDVTDTKTNTTEPAGLSSFSAACAGVLDSMMDDRFNDNND